MNKTYITIVTVLVMCAIFTFEGQAQGFTSLDKTQCQATFTLPDGSTVCAECETEDKLCGIVLALTT